MRTWKKSALAALCAVALGGFAGCDAPGDYGRDDDELREYPEKPGPLTGDEATGAGDVYDQPAGVGTPGQPPVQEPMQPEPWDQPTQQGVEQPGYQQPGYQQPGMQQPGMQQPGIEQQGLEPVDPNLGAGSTGTIEGGEMGIERPEGSTEFERPEGSTELEDDTSGMRAPGGAEGDDLPSPGTTTPGTTAPGTGGTGGTGSTGGTGGTGF